MEQWVVRMDQPDGSPGGAIIIDADTPDDAAIKAYEKVKFRPCGCTVAPLGRNWVTYRYNLPAPQPPTTTPTL